MIVELARRFALELSFQTRPKVRFRPLSEPVNQIAGLSAEFFRFTLGPAAGFLKLFPAFCQTAVKLFAALGEAAPYFGKTALYQR
ncbi:MAG: hypothetical protein LBS62_10140 [Clostridiales bacterium]|jgi:hypothetical protein|nr:hypothetical protein [Clostridiales bacterium]